jgi:hypothetical protein
LKELGDALKALIDKFGNFFDILDLSFLISGAVCLAACVCADQVLKIKLIDTLYHQGGFLAGIVACYVFGLIVFACGRCLRGLINSGSTFHAGLRTNGKSAFEDEFKQILTAHGLVATAPLNDGQTPLFRHDEITDPRRLAEKVKAGKDSASPYDVSRYVYGQLTDNERKRLDQFDLTKTDVATLTELRILLTNIMNHMLTADLFGSGCFPVAGLPRDVLELLLAFQSKPDDKMVRMSCNRALLKLAYATELSVDSASAERRNILLSYLAADRDPHLQRLYIRMWTEIRQNKDVAASYSFINRYWSLSATYDGLWIGLVVWMLIVCLSWFQYDQKHKVHHFSLIDGGFLGLLGVLLLLAWACFIQAGRYYQYQQEELAATYAYLLAHPQAAGGTQAMVLQLPITQATEAPPKDSSVPK